MTRALATVALGGAFAIGGPAWSQQGQQQQGQQPQPGGAQGQPQPGQAEPRSAPGTPAEGRGQTGQGVPTAVAAEVIMTTGTVQSVDKGNRTVVLKDASGDQVKVQVPPEMTRFDQLKKGDKIDATFYDSVAVALLPPGAARPGAEARVKVEPSQAGGFVGREVTTVGAQIINVDTKNNIVHLKLPDGTMQRVNVTDPTLQGQLKNLKPGQVATVTFTEAVAATIRPSGGETGQRGR
jgi:hypothetical protein